VLRYPVEPSCLGGQLKQHACDNGAAWAGWGWGWGRHLAALSLPLASQICLYGRRCPDVHQRGVPRNLQRQSQQDFVGPVLLLAAFHGCGVLAAAHNARQHRLKQVHGLLLARLFGLAISLLGGAMKSALRRTLSLPAQATLMLCVVATTVLTTLACTPGARCNTGCPLLMASHLPFSWLFD
jgi:hypothetical protein